MLQVYGSNYFQIVKERKYAPAEDKKGLLLMYTKQDCPKCEWNEAYFDTLAQEMGSADFIFAKMDLDKNLPPPEVKQFVLPDNPEANMLQFLAILPDGGAIKRFQKEDDSYEEIVKFFESARYLLNIYRGPQAKNEL